MDVTEVKKKSNLLKELGVLDVRYESVIKEKEVYLYKRNPMLFADLIEQEKKNKAELKADKIKTKKEIWRLRSMVHRFHEELKHVSPTPEFLEKVKEIMENIEKNLMEFKDSQREIFQQLMVSEAQHSHEIAAIEQKIESWSDLSLDLKTVKPVTKLPTSRDVVKDLPPEIAQFEKFVQQNGGVRGGWDEYDHSTFLKWRVRYKGKPSFLTEAISRLPTKTDSEVRGHEEWYQEYLRLQDIKKEAIIAWKIKKENEKKEGEIEDLSSDEDQNVMTQRQRDIIEKERIERQQQLSSWKLQKEIERAEEKERRERAEKKKKEKEEFEKRKKEELKQHVIEYKNRKREEDDFLAMQEQIQREYEEAEKRRELRLNQDRIELRNHIAVDSKIKRVKDEEQRRAKQKEKEKKLKEQYSVPVKRDPSRLLQPTAGWQARTKEVGASNESGRVYQLQSHRAVPSWRQGL